MNSNILDLEVINCDDHVYAQFKEKKSDVCYKSLEDIPDNYDLLIIQDNLGWLRAKRSINYRNLCSINYNNVSEKILVKRISPFNEIVSLDCSYDLIASVYGNSHCVPERYPLIGMQNNIYYDYVDELIKLLPLIVINKEPISEAIQAKLQDLFNIVMIRPGMCILSKKGILIKAANK
ncbi:hypothetical protein Hokovirus_1_297 [Hokovirus HKV1]|uniref:Uncharacterized protein n=1 Tax=Hokovirus HKV1 TaxID=1977638 RepID=A0A1V0SFL3_9VIRU|nr:hypothetical protein Hokovirus_1_297 [Hokovirus HKV1]